MSEKQPKKEPRKRQDYYFITTHGIFCELAWSLAKAVKEFLPSLQFPEGKLPEGFEVYAVVRKDSVQHPPSPEHIFFTLHVPKMALTAPAGRSAE
jgi:hypothetical protein